MSIAGTRHFLGIGYLLSKNRDKCACFSISLLLGARVVWLLSEYQHSFCPFISAMLVWVSIGRCFWMSHKSNAIYFHHIYQAKFTRDENNLIAEDGMFSIDSRRLKKFTPISLRYQINAVKPHVSDGFLEIGQEFTSSNRLQTDFKGVARIYLTSSVSLVLFYRRKPLLLHLFIQFSFRPYNFVWI